MRIGIDFDDTITDTNYSLIDILNLYRDKDEKISYEEFDESLCKSIWDFHKIKKEEFFRKSKYNERVRKEMDLCPLVKETINDLVKMGDKVYIFSSRPERDLEWMVWFLKGKGLVIEKENVYVGLEMEKMVEKLLEIEVDFYIDDDPDVLSICRKKGVLGVVRDQSYNRKYKNLIRMECFSQLVEIRNRIEKLKGKKMSSYKVG